MKKTLVLIVIAMMTVTTSAAVRIIVEDLDGKAAIKYQTDGELVRGFGLDVTVDNGAIVDINDFHRGESTAETPGYGIFMSAFASLISVDPNTGDVLNWDIKDYNPLADPCDAPKDTQPGLGSNGVTLEMGALYSPPTDDSPNAPGTSGLLCTLEITEKANVTVSLNKTRGGIVLTDPTNPAQVDLSKATEIEIDPTMTP